MKSFWIAVAFAAFPVLTPAAAPLSPAAVSLPKPRLEGKTSVEAALKARRSQREYAPTPLTLDEVGQLCWAAQGVTDEKGHRTAPSAMARYPLELYVIAGAVTGLPAGIYRYEPPAHALTLVAAGDRRSEFDRKAVGQKPEQVAKAPVSFVLTGNVKKMGGDRASQYMWVEAGLAAQGFFLEATAMELSSLYVGGFKPAEAHALLDLPDTEEVLAVLPVGKKP